MMPPPSTPLPPPPPPPSTPLPPTPVPIWHLRSESEMSESSIFSDVVIHAPAPVPNQIDATYDTFEISRTTFQQAADLAYYKNEHTKRNMHTPAFQVYTRDQATQTPPSFPKPIHQRRKFTISEIKDLIILN